MSLEELRRELVIEVKRRVMTKSRDAVDEVESFKYLESFVQKNGGFNEDVKHWVKCKIDQVERDVKCFIRLENSNETER